MHVGRYRGGKTQAGRSERDKKEEDAQAKLRTLAETTPQSAACQQCGFPLPGSEWVEGGRVVCVKTVESDTKDQLGQWHCRGADCAQLRQSKLLELWAVFAAQHGLKEPGPRWWGDDAVSRRSIRLADINKLEMMRAKKHAATANKKALHLSQELAQYAPRLIDLSAQQDSDTGSDDVTLRTLSGPISMAGMLLHQTTAKLAVVAQELSLSCAKSSSAGESAPKPTSEGMR